MIFLYEDQDDAAIYDAWKAELAAGIDEILPAQVSAAMLKGASLLKAIRLWRGISQSKISLVTGIGQGYLSDLENRRRAETPETI